MMHQLTLASEIIFVGEKGRIAASRVTQGSFTFAFSQNRA